MEKNRLNFKGTWRSYQERILNDLQFHLRDNKLHIVAAPGAGKTTLGIEIIARLNRPALVLCPTNTIKTQWQERVCDSFLAEDDYGLVSTNIREPRFITISTYQALLASFCSSDETADEDVVKGEVNEESDDEDGEKHYGYKLHAKAATASHLSRIQHIQICANPQIPAAAYCLYGIAVS